MLKKKIREWTREEECRQKLEEWNAYSDVIYHGGKTLTIYI